jgi:hypothetical protein
MGYTGKNFIIPYIQISCQRQRNGLGDLIHANFLVAQASRLCGPRLKPEATKFSRIKTDPQARIYQKTV